MAPSRWRILIIDDDEDDFILMRCMLDEVRRVECEARWAPTYPEGMGLLKEAEWSAILIDYDLGSNTGLELIRQAIAQGVEAPLIMVTGRGRYEIDLEAMEAGAVDYLTKEDLTSPALERAIRYAIREQQRADELDKRVRERTQDLQEANESLQTSLEEVKVLEEELHQQNDEIAESYKGMESRFDHFQMLYECAPEAYIVTDEYGNIQEANQEARLLLNVDGNELSKPLPVFISPEEKHRFYLLLAQLKEGRRGRAQRFHVKPRDGELSECCLSATAQKKEERLTFLWLINQEEAEQAA